MRVSSFTARCAACALFVALLGGPLLAEDAGAGGSSTLAQYRGRVHAAMLALDALASMNAEEAGTDEASVLAEVRRRLPRSERVSWQASVFVVDNEWLHAALDDYQKKDSSASQQERAAVLRQAAERLVALESRVAEIEREGAQEAHDKDAEKGRLANILRHPDFNQEAPKGNALERLIDRIFNSIAENLPEGRAISPGPSPRLSVAAQIFVFALALAVIAYVVRRYRGRITFGRGKRAPREARVVLGEHLTPDETASDLLNDAEQMARRGDLRGAIRKAYVALLCELDDRQVIRLAQHKTNRDYLRAVERTGHARLYEEMQPLTYDFERHWYGRQQATETDWLDYRTRCRRTLDSEVKA